MQASRHPHHSANGNSHMALGARVYLGPAQRRNPNVMAHFTYARQMSFFFARKRESFFFLSFFSRKREKNWCLFGVFLVFNWCFIGVLLVFHWCFIGVFWCFCALGFFFCFSRVSAFFLGGGLFFALSQAKPGISSLAQPPLYDRLRQSPLPHCLASSPQLEARRPSPWQPWR